MTIPFEKMVFVNESATDYVYRCPFCGDSSRHSNKGHLYISKTKPIYHCLRCGASGYINRIEEFLHEKSKVDYRYTLRNELRCFDAKGAASNTSDVISMFLPYVQSDELTYVTNRCVLPFTQEQLITYTGIVPHSMVQQMFPENSYQLPDGRTWFMSCFGSLMSGRVHHVQNDATIRYLIFKTKMPWAQYVLDDCYMIRSPAFEKRTFSPRLVVAEGVFDIIPIYAARTRYRLADDDVYTASLCKQYTRPIGIYRVLAERMPREIVIFADVDASVPEITKMFQKCGLVGTIPITVYHAADSIKDWTNVPSIGSKHTI